MLLQQHQQQQSTKSGIYFQRGLCSRVLLRSVTTLILVDSHEPSPNNTKNINSDNVVDMNVTLIAINSVLRPLSIMTMDRYVGGVKPLDGNVNGDRIVVLRVDDKVLTWGERPATSETTEQQREREQRLNCFGIDFSGKQSYPFFASAEPLPLSSKKHSKCEGPLVDMFRELPLSPTAS